MRIMAAGVHHGHLKPVHAHLPGLGRIGQARSFFDRQAVHISSQHDNGAVAIFKNADNASPAHFFGDCHAGHGPQFFGHARRRIKFAEGKLGITMEIIPQGAQ